MTNTMHDTIDLSQWALCAEGRQREIYQSTQDPDILIKVIKPEGRGVRGARKTSRKLYWFRRFRRYGAYMTFRREIDEYLEQARKVEGNERFDMPIPRIFGLAHTTRGLGLMVERIANRDGKLAPTLTQLILSGRFTPSHMALIDQFFERCRRAHLVMMDVNPSNFVVTDRTGSEQLFCIDGTGEKQFFHIHAASRVLNAIKLRLARRKLMDKIARTQRLAEERQAQQGVLPDLATSR